MNDLVVSPKTSTKDTLQADLIRYRPLIEKILPPTTTFDRMLRLSLMAVAANKDLAACRASQILGCVMQAAVLGMEPSSPLGECFLVPYAGQCQLVIGYRGQIRLIRNDGHLRGVVAREVRELDEFRMDMGTEPSVVHRYHHLPARGEIRGYWAGILMDTNYNSIEYMSVADVRAWRDKYCKGANSSKSAWKTHEGAMSLKTVLGRAGKYVPKGMALAIAEELNERADAGLVQRFSPEIPDELQPEGHDGDPITEDMMPKRKGE